MTTRPLTRILLVEDDPDIQDVTSLLLSELASFDVRACASAREGLQTAPTFAPDLILLDMMMPEMDGETALVAFRQLPATATTPIIYLTSQVQPEQLAKYRKLGSLGVIPKPYDPNTLAETIQSMWDKNQVASATEARRDALASLRRRYAEELPERLRALAASAAVLRVSGWNAEVVASIHEAAHRLAGSAAIYGFPEVSVAAQRVGGMARQLSSARVDPAPLLTLLDALLATHGRENRANRTLQAGSAAPKQRTVNL